MLGRTSDSLQVPPSDLLSVVINKAPVRCDLTISFIFGNVCGGLLYPPVRTGGPAGAWRGPGGGLAGATAITTVDLSKSMRLPSISVGDGI